MEKKPSFKKISATRKFMFPLLVPNFADFRPNNRACMQKNHEFKKYYLCRAWISGQDGGIHTQNYKSCRKESWARETPALKNSQFFRNFCFYEMKLPIFEKIVDFGITLDNFLASVIISYCRSGCDIFQILPGIDFSSIRKFGLSRRISCILWFLAW